jgi:L-lactate dehydrogenase complex protein LldG
VNAKEEILARIATALQDRPKIEATAREYHHAGTTTVDDVVGLFEQRVLDYKADVRRCTPGELVATIAQALADRGATRIVVPDGVPGEWHVGGVVDEPQLSSVELDELDGVLTACAVGIAETGTIVLDHGPGQGRRALSLVPDYHVCVIRTDQIVHSVPDAIAALDPLRPLTWISGGSATSDIELNRVEGVHGPRHLCVIIVTQSE